MPKAKEAALKALEIDKALAEAHTSLAFISAYYEWDWKGAEEKYKRAIELNPNYATAHHWYAVHLGNMTRFDEAIKEINRALELDPLSLIINRNVGQMLYCSRRFNQAIAALKRIIEKDPNFLRVHHYLGLAYLQKSMYEEALTEFQKERDLKGGIK